MVAVIMAAAILAAVAALSAFLAYRKAAAEPPPAPAPGPTPAPAPSPTPTPGPAPAPIPSPVSGFENQIGMNVSEDLVLSATRNATTAPTITYFNNVLSFLPRVKAKWIRLSGDIGAYEGNEQNFLAQLNTILSKCQQNGILVLLNPMHLWEYVAQKTLLGVPASWLLGYNRQTAWDNEAKAWYRNYYTDQLRQTPQVHAKTLQYLVAVANIAATYPVCRCIQIFNEPPVFADTDYPLLTAFHKKMLDGLRAQSTFKGHIGIVRDIPRGGYSGNVGLRAKTLPPDPLKKGLFDSHRYGVNAMANNLQNDMNTVAQIEAYLGYGIEFVMAEWAVQSDQFPNIATMTDAEIQIIMDRGMSAFFNAKAGHAYYSDAAPGEGNALRAVTGGGQWDLSRYGRIFLNSVVKYYG